MDSIGIGLIGVGNMGATHARNIIEGKVPRARLAAVCDTDPSRLEPFSATHCTTSADELLNRPDLDAVIVATPHFSHAPLSIAALERGKHLLVEKPIAPHTLDCQRMIDAHTDDGLVFAAMFNQRTNPTYLRLREMIQSGELGQLRRVVWIITDWFRTDAYYRSSVWRATWRGEGGGVLLNQSVHQLDLWQWLFGMPRSIRAFCHLGRYHDVEVEDDVTAYLEYDDGMSGVFITTTGEAPGTNRLEVTGELAKVVIDASDGGMRIWRNACGASEFARTSERGFASPETTEDFIAAEGRGPQHAGIIENFCDAILDGSPVIARAEEGIRSVELANAMLESAFRRETLELPLDAESYAARLMELAGD